MSKKKRKEIVQDFSYMQWFRSFLNKRQIYRKDGTRIEFLYLMHGLGHLVFTYESNYQVFFKAIEHQVALKKEGASEGKTLFLDEVKNTMAHELAIFYFRNYKISLFFKELLEIKIML